MANHFIWGKRLFSILLTVFLVPAFMSTAGAAEEVVLQLRWFHQFQFAGYYAAKEQGYYRDAGLNVVFREAQMGRDTVDEVVSGRAHYGISGTDLVIRRNKGSPIVALAAIFQHSPLILLSRADSKISSPQDLVGRRVMIRRPDDVQTLGMLVNEGVPLDRIDFIDHTFNFEALLDGTIDAATAFITTQPAFLKEMGIEPSYLQPSTYGIDFYGDTLFTSEKELKSNPERARAFKNASLKGWAYAMANKEETVQLIKNKYKSKVSLERLRYEATAMEKIILPNFIEIGHMNVGRWKHISETYVSQKQLSQNYSLDGFLYNPDPAAELKPLYRTIIIISVAAMVFLLISVYVWGINAKLRNEVKIRLRSEEELTAAKKQTENALTKLRDSQDQIIQSSKLASLGEMATGIAHELNQPLNIISITNDTLTEMMEGGEHLSTDYLKERLERIASQTERAVNIIDHMRLFGRTPMEHATKISPRDAVLGAIDFQREQLRLEEIELNLDIPETCRPVMGDQIQLEQVFLNLLSNARDAIVDKSGKALEGKNAVTVKIEDDPATDLVRLIVEDTGGGIPEDVLPNIFDPFLTTKEVGKGTGIGLSISHGIVVGMKGTLIASNIDGGARFTITLTAVDKELDPA